MARLAKALNTEKAEEKQKRKQDVVVQKPVAVKKPNETNNKPKQIEKNDVDSEAGKAADKKPANDKKLQDKKDAKTTKPATIKKPVVKANKEKDDKEDFTNDIDFEMGDIVILDEYDSSKSNEVRQIWSLSFKCVLIITK